MDRATSPKPAAQASVDPAVVRIGADLVELLTSGMYVSPLTIFREYVQNAADAIDQARATGALSNSEVGLVEIAIDHNDRTVSVRDNGSGIKEVDVAELLLAIGGSTKRGTSARGFRGIGRLSGLAYCQHLEFRTKAAGEAVESLMKWDSVGLRRAISGASRDADLRAIIAGAVEIQTLPVSDIDSHYFEVTLRSPARHRQDLLLNERAIAHYLSQVAPVAFSPEFSLGDEIIEAFAERGFALPTVELKIQGEPVYRPYRDALTIPGTDKSVHLNDLEIFEALDVDGNVGALVWIANHEYVRSLSVALGVRGLRARVGNVEVGEEDLFDDLFKEPRFNGWTVGEVHVIDRRITPNGRRDNFEVNHHSNQLLAQLRPISSMIANRCRTSSINRNSTMIVRNTVVEVEDLLAKTLLEPVQISRAIAAVKRGTEKLRSVDADTRADLQNQLANLTEQLEGRRGSQKAGIIPLEEAIVAVGRIVTNHEQCRKLIQSLRELEG